MKSPLINGSSQKSVVQPQSSKTKAGNICFTFICWIVSLSLWGMIGYITVNLYFLRKEGENIDDLITYSYVCLAVYGFYLILEFCSPTSRYLIHKRSNEGIKNKMGELFRTRPSINFSVECYHYETEYYTERNSKGEDVERTRQVKVVSHRETEAFDYYSVRDVSGLLNLNCDKAQIKNKCYIKLELKEEMNFADAISVSDYEAQKEDFKERNRHRDEYMDFSESWKLPGITHHNLIKIGDYEPCTVNCFWYITFTLFTLAQFYKWHVASFCIYQNYKIRKIMSTRYNLHSAEFDAQYSKFNPQINLITLRIDYDPSYYSYLNQSKHVRVPTNEELNKAKKYDNKVPRYQIYTEADGDIRRTGTVKDNPDFADYNTYQAPQVQVNVTPLNNQEIPLSEINTQSNLNSDFNNNNNGNEKKRKKKQPKNGGYNSVQQGGYNSAQEGIGGGGIYSPIDNIPSQEGEGGGIYAQPSGGGIYAQPSGGNIYNQPQGGSIYAQPPSGNIYAQPPGGNIYAQPPEGEQPK